jgi:acyl carrier protein
MADPIMPTEVEIYGALTEIFRDVFMRDDMMLVPELTANDVPEWDSFKQIEIVIAAEEQFNIKLSTRELDSLRCVGDLARLVAVRTACS